MENGDGELREGLGTEDWGLGTGGPETGDGGRADRTEESI
eukprot:CAMPEP_0181394546 /NCGR_PEP_ID=MMETSP1106-20121128/27838_1 /TAXON_ID=81844 /ORGANISM="Mantoniella antarctica, Strain SL-175" /LENGTH=39 /DNA_ID= /DNA_START= /DNA_END= /DNA_ORIENTATION=